MKTEIHGFVVVIHDLNANSLKHLCRKHLKSKLQTFKMNSYACVKTYVKRLGNTKESICIKQYNYPDRRYTTINLHGSFFDVVKDFRMDQFIKHISEYDCTPKQLDIAFNDDKKLISKKLIKYWCNYCEDNCIGSMVEKQAPDIVITKRKLNRIQLLSPKSKVNYGTIYFRPDTKQLRLEIKFRDKFKIRQLLGTLVQGNAQFEDICRRALVSCINFIRPSSRKSRKPEKYKMHPEWEAFLGGNVQKIVWSKQDDTVIVTPADPLKNVQFTRTKPNLALRYDAKHERQIEP